MKLSFEKSIKLNRLAFFLFLLSILNGYAQPLSGDYLIGIGEEYETLNTAVDDLSEFGVDGPVVFNILSGVYNEQIVLNEISGSSELNTITFQSLDIDSSSVIVEFDAVDFTEYIVKLWNVDFIHFKQLTFKILGTSNNTIFDFSGGGRFSSITNCALLGSGLGGGAIIECTNPSGIPKESLILNNNLFVGGSVVMDFDGRRTGMEINNNVFDSPTSRFLDIEDVSNLTIYNNSFIGDPLSESVLIGQCDSNFVFEENIFTDKSYVYFDNIGGSPTSVSKIKNNVILGRLRLYKVEYMDLLNNSIYNLGSAESACIHFTGSEFLHVNFYNNIFAHQNGGMVLYSTEIFYGLMFDSDYNCYYSSLSRPFKEVAFGEVVNRNFEEWQFAKARDEYGYFTSPNFVNSHDLHIDNASAINNKGVHFEELPTDFDGELRDFYPDIGADEFEMDSTTYRDLEISQILSPIIGCIENDSLIIQLNNNSIFDLDSFTVKMYLFDELEDSVFHIINIPAQDSVSLFVATFDFIPNVNYKFRFVVQLPNGEYDHYFDNNILEKYLYNINDIKIFKITNEYCTTEIELFLKDFPRASVIWSTGDDDDEIIVSDPGEYSVIVTDETGCEYTDIIIIEE